ncbi:MAG TPA: NAD(P)(+) transhydrogenase (Re/Si-specific) subunit alpha, partial [Terriglobales bacterium]|nr:NAD(P)(+) transhydrogenase (Re/Si-specific) subunit alpha [Terriglobales bacterium]
MTRTAGDIDMKVGVAKEIAPGERRVALVPESIEKLRAAGMSVFVERGAGVEAAFPDSAYVEAGARIVATPALYSNCDVILRINRPTPTETKHAHAGQVIIGMLAPLLDPAAMAEFAESNLTTVSLDAIPRTLSRAQGMDALSSQANVAGYKAVLVAAEAFGRYFPLLTTSAGTAKPANVLILGIGVAGLQAIATARRLG